MITHPGGGCSGAGWGWGGGSPGLIKPVQLKRKSSDKRVGKRKLIACSFQFVAFDFKTGRLGGIKAHQFN